MDEGQIEASGSARQERKSVSISKTAVKGAALTGGGLTIATVISLIMNLASPKEVGQMNTRDISRLEQTVMSNKVGLEQTMNNNKAEVLKRIDDKFDQIKEIVERSEREAAKNQDREERKHERFDLRLQNLELLANSKPHR